MNRKEKAEILLDCIDKYAPTNINWNLEKIEEKKEKESETK